MTGTSDAPGQVMGASFREDSGGIMSSIAAVRELLEKNGSSSPESSLKYEISAIKQSRYEDRLRFEEQIQKQNDSIRDFQIKLQQVEQEAQSEKSLRQTLEKTNEALDEHKKELTAQLELVSKSRGSLEGTVVGFRSSLEEEKVAFLKEKERLEALVNELSLQKKNELENTGEWEARFLTSQRQTEELNADVVALIDQMESARVRHQETIQDYTKSIETVKQRLEETDAARKVAEEKLKSSMPQENKDNSSDLRPRLDASERQVKILKAQKLILQTQMGGKLVEHQGIIQEHVKSNKDMGRRLQEEEIARKKAEEKLEKVKTELDALKRGMSAEQLEKEKEVEEKIVSKVTSLTGSLGKMSKQSESLRMELANLEKGPQNSKQAAEALAKKKEELAHGTAKIGAVFETMQGELEQRLKIAKVKGEKRSIELATVRERWRQANHDVTDAQAELDGCQTRIAELENKGLGATSEKTTSSSPSKTMPSKKPANKPKSNTPTPEKRTNDDDNMNTKRRRKK